MPAVEVGLRMMAAEVEEEEEELKPHEQEGEQDERHEEKVLPHFASLSQKSVLCTISIFYQKASSSVTITDR